MIERDTNELRGQMELSDFTTREVEADSVPEGYDAEGRLLNEDWPAIKGTGNSEQGTGIVEGYDSEGQLLNIDYAPVGASKMETPTPTDTQTSAEGARLVALATEINAITEQTRGVVISAALAVGKRLIEAKQLCPEGRFGEWLASSVNYSERKAQDMMRLYTEYGREGAIPESIAALDYSKAVALLSAPPEAREALAGKAAEEELSVRQLQEEIKRLKAEAAEAQQSIFDKDYLLGRTRREMEEVEGERDRADENLKAARAAIEKEREAARLAQAKAAAAEASADELRRLHSDAEDRAAASAQRASDAVNRANQTAKDLAEARAKIQALSEAAAAATAEPERVEVVPEAVQRELDELRKELAEARAEVATAAAGTSSVSASGAATFPKGEGSGATATEKFKWFYANQMKPAFTTALNLLREVAREDGKTADAFATALTRACQQLMNQLGNGEG